MRISNLRNSRTQQIRYTRAFESTTIRVFGCPAVLKKRAGGKPAKGKNQQAAGRRQVAASRGIPNSEDSLTQEARAGGAGRRQQPAGRGRDLGVGEQGRGARRHQSCGELELLDPYQVQGRRGSAPPFPMDLQPQFCRRSNPPHGLIQRSALRVAARQSRDRRHVETVLIAFQNHSESSSLPNLLHGQ
jgi:hypothetical protein